MLGEEAVSRRAESREGSFRVRVGFGPNRGIESRHPAAPIEQRKRHLCG
jgi:hypothetical protein